MSIENSALEMNVYMLCHSPSKHQRTPHCSQNVRPELPVLPAQRRRVVRNPPPSSGWWHWFEAGENGEE